MLTDALQSVHESVVLFDEVEKAHPKVHQLLLQVLDEGHLTDSKGRRASLADSLVLMTSNLGTRELLDAAESMGFGGGVRALETVERRGIVTRALRRSFAPEFLARIDEVLVFNDLDGEDCRAIAALEIEKLRAKLARRGLRLRVRREVVEWVAARGYSPRQGAREIARVVARELEDPLAERIVAERPAAGSLAMLKLEDERPRVELRSRRW
jgi:ATP-dependent Clp protease ATP-binding subunit ClpC